MKFLPTYLTFYVQKTICKFSKVHAWWTAIPVFIKEWWIDSWHMKIPCYFACWMMSIWPHTVEIRQPFISWSKLSQNESFCFSSVRIIQIMALVYSCYWGTNRAGRQSITEQHRHTGQHITNGNLKRSVNPTVLILDWGKKLEYPERTHARTTFKLQTGIFCQDNSEHIS